MVPACSGGVEAHGAAINQFRRIQLGLAVHLTPETQFGVALGVDNARTRLKKGRPYFLDIIADRRHNSHAGNDDASHGLTP